MNRRLAESERRLFDPEWRRKQAKDDGRLFGDEIRETVHPIEPNVCKLPFKRIPYKSYFELTKGIPHMLRNTALPSDRSTYEAYREFAADEKTRRQNYFEAAKQDQENPYHWTSADCELLERYLIQSSAEGQAFMITILYHMGKETDMEYVEFLEKKYDVYLEQLRMICEMDQATEMEDDLLFLVKDLLTREPTTAEMKQMKEGVQVLVDRARFLSQFSVLATHATKTKTVDAVESSAQIYKSQDRNFEGDGVYFGIFGSFKEWGDEYFTVRIPLAYAHPNTRITSNGYGQAMINVLCDAVILRSEDAPVRMRGLLQWRRPEDYDWYKVWEDETGEETVYSIFPRWKLDLIKELIPNKSVEIAKDKSGQSCLVMDTQELPIVWASVCRALCIPRLIPLSELEDFGWKRGEPIPDDSFLSRRAIQLSTINAALDLTDPKFRYGTQERRPAHEDDDVPLNTLPPSDEQDRSSTLNW